MYIYIYLSSNISSHVSSSIENICHLGLTLRGSLDRDLFSYTINRNYIYRFAKFNFDERHLRLCIYILDSNRQGLKR